MHPEPLLPARISAEPDSGPLSAPLLCPAQLLDLSTACASDEPVGPSSPADASARTLDGQVSELLAHAATLKNRRVVVVVMLGANDYVKVGADSAEVVHVVHVVHGHQTISRSLYALLALHGIATGCPPLIN